MNVVSEFLSAISSFAAIMEALKSPGGVGKKKREELSNLGGKVNEALSRSVDLYDENMRLKRKLIEYDNWDKTARKYKLADLPTGDGLAYSLKSNPAPDEPHHYICPQCYDGQARSILQTWNKGYRCNRCKWGSPGVNYVTFGVF